MISYTVTGSTKKTEDFLKHALKVDIQGILNSCGQEGVNALSRATPEDSGRAANSWSFETTKNSITWTNSDIENGFPVVIMLQYGHGTKTGGWVQGRDFINPAIRPIFDKIADKVWKAVTSQ